MEERLGIYISVPFCRAKCSFCNFASDAFGMGRMPAYIAALCREIVAVRERAGALGATLPREADSVYLGGGTPSLLQAGDIRTIFAALRGEFSLQAGAEITVECAPGQLSEATLAAFQREGVNRISFGVQSFVDEEATAVGRLHTATVCRQEISRLRSAGIGDVGIDLIAGLPLQTLASWETSLEELVSSGANHASVYMLEVDEDSRLGREMVRGGARYAAQAVPSEDEVAIMYERACDVLPGNGLQQYEISNFAREAKQSRHNLKYWARQPYIGFGLDAHSMLRCSDGGGELRFANEAELEQYLQRGSGFSILQEPDRETDELRPRRVSGRAAMEEALFLGLRTNEGITLAELPASEGERATIERLLAEAEADGLASLEHGVARLSTRGRLLSNEVFARLLESAES